MPHRLPCLKDVKTIDRVAAELGETVDRLFDLAIDMEIEDGVIWVYGLNDTSPGLSLTHEPAQSQDLCRRAAHCTNHASAAQFRGCARRSVHATPAC